MAWLQLSMDLKDMNPEAVQADCECLGALSVTLADAADDPVLEPPPGTTPVWPQTRLSALFEGDDHDAHAGEQLRGALADRLGIEVSCITVEPLPERDWCNEWRKNFRPLCFGSKLWICQDGQRPEDPRALVVDLDPGLAFGTGSHPSTALCLDWLCRADIEGRSLIDYGCGSGILALAAARLGAARVLATDIDPQALLATRDNAAHNSLENKIAVLRPDDLGDCETDILVANILSSPLRQLAPRFADLVAPGGQIALAGILEEQIASMHGVFESAFALSPVGRRDGWALLSGRRRH